MSGINGKPIIFSAEMVRAILEGRKTMTRRLVNPKRKPLIPGDLLWVKETWCYNGFGQTHYRATEPEYETYPTFLGWQSSMLMPRCQSRILLEVTQNRIERLTDISEEDAKQEGFSDKEAFHDYWNFIYRKKPELQWNENLEVYAISFRKLERDKNESKDGMVTEK